MTEVFYGSDGLQGVIGFGARSRTRMAGISGTHDAGSNHKPVMNASISLANNPAVTRAQERTRTIRESLRM